MKSIYSSIELLESRIAPATITGKTIIFNDVDGDLVKITASSGSLTGTVVNTPDAQHLQLTLLDATSAPKANISFVVTKASGGDGYVNIGALKATNVDLGMVTIPGDLGDVDCGSGSATVPAIAALKVRSLGQLGTLTGATVNGDGTVESDIKGSLSMLTITGNENGVYLNVTGKVGPVTIGGSLIGGSTKLSGELSSTNGYGPIVINGSILGGSSNFTGSIASTGGKIASITVKRSVIGGNGFASGYILNSSTGSLGPVKIGGDLVGGNDQFSGSINSYGPMAGVTIAGSLNGGSSDFSGSIVLQPGGVSMGAIKIGRDMTGGSEIFSGSIISKGTLASVTIGGSLFGFGVGGKFNIGEIMSTGNMGPIKIAGVHDRGLSNSGAIDSGGKIASLTVGGYSSGGITAVNNIGPVTIGGFFEGAISTTAGGLASLLIKGYVGGNNVSSIFGKIGSITILGSIVDATGIRSTNGTIGMVNVLGSIEHGSGISSADLLGPVKIGGNLSEGSTVSSVNGNVTSVTIGGSIAQGTVLAAHGNIGSVTVTGNAEKALIIAGYQAPNTQPIQIGTVKVGGDWIASSVSAGFKDMGGNGFGNADDVLVAQSSKIAAITIGGQIIGTATAGDHFGFDAHTITTFKVGTNTVLLPPAPNDVVFSGITGGDVTIHLAP